MKTNIIVGQSGGPSAAINASLAGVIRQAMRSEEIGEIYGALNGIEGLLNRKIINLRSSFETAEDFDLLAATPAAALNSCRFKLPPAPHEAYGQIEKIFSDYGIGMFFYIGGNDSMDTVKQLSEYFKGKGKNILCVGVPKTIDNDLPVTDHTPGFASAAKYVAASIAEIDRDSRVYDMFSVVIVEIMGRNAGWLAASAALARDTGCPSPHLIYLPEAPFDPEDFVERVRSYSGKNDPLIIAVSEGLKTADGKYLNEGTASSAKDAFGHARLEGTGGYLSDLITDRLDCKVRCIELSLLQRAAGHYASATDISEAMKIGEEGVRAALEGKTGVMMKFERVSSDPYLVQVGTVPIEECANLEKTVPVEWIVNGSDVSEELMNYLRPLIAGRAPYFEKNGLPNFKELDKTIVSK